jgi:RNA polymerase sigma-70 factor (ECF subfamily)
MTYVVTEACIRPQSRMKAERSPPTFDGVEIMMRRHNRRLFRLARGVLGNGAEAEDVVQETHVRAFAKLDEFRGPDGFSAWLARIAYNEALGRC